MLRERVGRITGNMPFEGSWMADYIDLKLDINASRTRRLLDWEPDKNLHILKRIPNMIQNLRDNPKEWERRNTLKKVRMLTERRVQL